MKHTLSILITLCCIITCTTTKEPPTSVIFDTDMGPDYDDVGALAMLHAMADSGEVNILATVTSNLCETAIPCIEAINTYFKRPNIPTGAVKGEAPNMTTWHKGLRWTEEIPKNYPHKTQSTSKSEDALNTYRRILSTQPDTSVTIVTVGFFSNLKNLILSQPDSISSLTGKELINKKVKRLVSMAGAFPNGKEFNVYIDSTASQIVFKEWPTPIYLSGFDIGEKILTGKRLAASNTKGNPVVDVFSMCLPQDNPEGRMSWDETAVLFAVRGERNYFKTESGTLSIADDGSDTWTPNPNGKHKRLILNTTVNNLTDIIETLMMHEPQK